MLNVRSSDHSDSLFTWKRLLRAVMEPDAPLILRPESRTSFSLSNLGTVEVGGEWFDPITFWCPLKPTGKARSAA